MWNGIGLGAAQTAKILCDEDRRRLDEGAVAPCEMGLAALRTAAQTTSRIAMAMSAQTAMDDIDRDAEDAREWPCRRPLKWQRTIGTQADASRGDVK